MSAAASENADQLATERAYFTDTYKFKSDATLIETGRDEKGEYLIFDKTIFHPQGGGQPSDFGFVEGRTGRFKVNEMKQVGDQIHHYGTYDYLSPDITVGEKVQMEIDQGHRMQSARIHSAGHLIDIAMNRAGRTDLKPGKGYHYPNGAYVEYIGIVEEKDREALAEELTKHCADLIEEAKGTNEKVYREILSYEDANRALEGAGGVPSYIPEGNELRVLKLVKEDPGCPCGGTHVHAIPDIGRVVVKKIQKKKKNTRVSYEVFFPKAEN